MGDTVIKKSVNWSRGFHRLFSVLWVLWIIYLFIGIPIQQIHQAEEFAISMYKSDLSTPPENEQEKTEREARQKELWARASWSHVYKSQIFPDIWLVLGAALLLPMAVYIGIRGVLWLFLWLYHGFRAH